MPPSKVDGNPLCSSSVLILYVPCRGKPFILQALANRTPNKCVNKSCATEWPPPSQGCPEPWPTAVLGNTDYADVYKRVQNITLTVNYAKRWWDWEAFCGWLRDQDGRLSSHMVITFHLGEELNGSGRFWCWSHWEILDCGTSTGYW